MILSNLHGDAVGFFLISNILYYQMLGKSILVMLFAICLLLIKSRIINYKVGLLAILLFLISPLLLRYGMEWPNHSNWGWILIYLFFLIKIVKDPMQKSPKYFILAGLFFAIAFIENPYHGVELSIISIPLALSAIIRIRKGSFKYSAKLILNLFILAIFPLISVFYINNLYTRLSNTTLLNSAFHSTSDRWAFSARPWHYLIPDIDHPVLGDLATKAHYWIWQHPPYYLTEVFFPKEHTLFLGYTLMILSLYAVYKYFGKGLILGIVNLRKSQKDIFKHIQDSINSNNVFKQNQSFYLQYFLIIGITAFIFSMPPYMAIGGFKIYFPSYFIYPFLPQFRAYARFGVFVFISNAVIAMIGLQYLLSQIKSKFKKNTIFGIIAFLIIFEFLPSYKAISISPIPPYVWLSQQSGEFAYLEVPTRADYTDKLYKHTSGHNKMILNPYLDTPSNVRLLEDSLWNANTPFAKPDSLWCVDFIKMGGRYLMYHEKELNKRYVVEDFIRTKRVTPNLKVALAESWGQPVWGNHVSKTAEDIAKDQRQVEIKKLLLNDPKFIKIAEFDNQTIIDSRPNKNFSADKFDAVTIFEINKDYCDTLSL